MQEHACLSEPITTYPNPNSVTNEWISYGKGIGEDWCALTANFTNFEI